MQHLNDRALAKVAEIFKALAEPRRLILLNALRDGPRNVSELVDIANTSQANVSKHLALLLQVGIVSREQRGNCVYYGMADPATFELCDLVCGQLLRKTMAELEWQQLMASTREPA